ncbi:MAG: hypothetical protein A7315_05955 [Candidatus Altiarchaeales archaeon WOR_SM1_79]|nr:MAG: hypothetical protein A7315_05955 [Candidatus Altiarchaeales archaeon WOR_SM1_79]
MKILREGQYVSWWDNDRKDFVFRRLLQKEGPLTYPRTFTALTTDTKSDLVIFDELDPDEKHIYQLLLGVSPGVYYYVWHPYDEKMLKWDEAGDITDIDEDQTAVLEYEDTPYNDPQFEVWVIPDKYPALQVKRIQHEKVIPRVVFKGFKFNYEEVTDPTVLDNLKKGRVPSHPISWRKLE